MDTAVANSFPQNSALNFAIAGKLITGPGGIGRTWIIKWNNSQSVISVNFGKTKFLVSHGYIQLKAVNAPGLGFRIEATNWLRLHDEYLYGIAEVPSSWPAAALQSQVIASRTYALMRMNSIKKACDCHVYNSKYDQAFVGYSKEGEPRYGHLWKAAVDATAVDAGSGLAITINQLPVSVFFSSSSGGMTQRAVDVWGTDIPHLENVADPWSIDPAVNKNYASWTKKVSQKVMAKAFGFKDVIEVRLGERTATNSVLNVTGVSSDGKSKTLPVGIFKSAVKMPSSWFELITLN
ncbi:MAG: SpoIID/LytB domain-containing protein [Actinobacteria bacterium]|nr:SpoIID/LytB domain-containing protein [Actinomycetota bacterium]